MMRRTERIPSSNTLCSNTKLIQSNRQGNGVVLQQGGGAGDSLLDDDDKGAEGACAPGLHESIEANGKVWHGRSFGNGSGIPCGGAGPDFEFFGRIGLGGSCTVLGGSRARLLPRTVQEDRKSTRLNSSH